MDDVFNVLDESNNKLSRCASSLTVLRVALENKDSYPSINYICEMLLLLENELRVIESDIDSVVQELK